MKRTEIHRLPTTPSVEIRESLDRLDDALSARLDTWLAVASPEAFRSLELSIAELMRKSGDEITKAILGARLSDDAFQDGAVTAARASTTKAYRPVERRSVSVTLLGGTKITVPTKYMRQDIRKRSGRRRKCGGRGKGGTGLHPALATLGIWFGVTPGVADEICRQVADSDSVRAGRQALARRNLDLGHKETLRIVNHVGHRLVGQRDEWVAIALEKPPQSGPLSEKRVVIAADGGRIRERSPARHGRKRANGHRRYDAPWREPKLFAIYTIDEDGKAVDSFRPVYDGTLGDCDVIFSMLVGYLRSLGAHEAQEIEILGDGAKWIWERADQLAASLQIPPERITQVVDWYHAVETLGEIAAARTSWTETERHAWLEETKTSLYKGDMEAVLAGIDALSKGRNAKLIKKHRAYFARNAARMTYAAFKRRHLAIGSGAVESAIRRVVNLRMKGNGTFWLEKNAEAMLLMRAYVKSDRFDDLILWSLASAAPWTGAHRDTGPIREPRVHASTEPLAA